MLRGWWDTLAVHCDGVWGSGWVFGEGGYEGMGEVRGGLDERRRGVAPFRLLVLADPQIEGDSSLPRVGDGFWDRVRRHWGVVWGGDGGVDEVGGGEVVVEVQHEAAEGLIVGDFGSTEDSDAVPLSAPAEPEATDTPHEELPSESVELGSESTILDDALLSDVSSIVAEPGSTEDDHIMSLSAPAESDATAVTEAESTSGTAQVVSEGTTLEGATNSEDSNVKPAPEDSNPKNPGASEEAATSAGYGRPEARSGQKPLPENLIVDSIEMVSSEISRDIHDTQDELPNPPISWGAIEEEIAGRPQIQQPRSEPKSRMTLAMQALRTILTKDILDALKAQRKKIDIFGNDYYLAHIYRTLHWWTMPSHVTVLGDLIGSQWVNDDEFDWRGRRYWNRVLAGGERVDESITTLDDETQEMIFDIDEPAWKRRIINIAGNHDIGYAGDISEARMERFERVFGKANWDVRFQYPAGVGDDPPPSLHLINLNSLLLDTPALSDELQAETYAYMNSVIGHRSRPVEDKTSFTLLLTHLPLFKKAGTCVDAPFFDFWGNDDGGGVYKPRGLKEQNHLSKHASQPGTLEAIYGMAGDLAAAGQGKGRHGLILNGHDHEGCDTWHHVHSSRVWNSSEDEPSNRKTQWAASKIPDADSSMTHTGIREITLRSMMGDYGGNAGLLSAWYDFHQKSWKYEFQTCKVGTQHIWWAVHVIDLIVLLGFISLLFTKPVPTPKVVSERHSAEKKNGTAEKKK